MNGDDGGKIKRAFFRRERGIFRKQFVTGDERSAHSGVEERKQENSLKYLKLPREMTPDDDDIASPLASLRIIYT